MSVIFYIFMSTRVSYFMTYFIFAAYLLPRARHFRRNSATVISRIQVKKIFGGCHYLQDDGVADCMGLRVGCGSVMAGHA